MSGHTPQSAASLRSDERGVSPVIAVVLLLAIALLALTVLQANAIPLLNSQAEFEHSQRVQTDMVEFDAATSRAAASGQRESAPVELGLRYRQRLLFINPPPVSGTLESTAPSPVVVENARATGETGDYWDGTARSFETRSLVYRPAYNEYEAGATTVYEPWVVYNRVDDQTLPRTEQSLVDGRRISLVALDGRYSQSATDTVGVDIAPTSAPVRTVTVSNSADPIQLRIPTQLRNDTWGRLLDDQLDQPGDEDDRAVTGYTCESDPPQPCGELTLTLEPGSYELALGETAVGTGASGEPAAYLTDVEGQFTSVPETGRQRLVVEARDRYDNPVSGVTVTSDVVDGPGFVRPVSPTTDENGRAVFVYESPEDVARTRSVTVESTFGDADPQRTVAFDIQVTNTPGAADAQTSAAAISTVDGTVDSANIRGSDRGREATFDIVADRSVTVTSLSVTTQNELLGRPYIETDTTVGGTALPSSIDGQVTVALRDIITSRDLPINRFVEPDDPEADILVTFEFADGSLRTIALA